MAPLPLGATVAADSRLPTGEVGMRVQAATLGATPEQLKGLGEAAAKRRLGPESTRVWVWVYGADMDLSGPAACTSYVDVTSKAPVTEFTHPAVLVSWYSQQAQLEA